MHCLINSSGFLLKRLVSRQIDKYENITHLIIDEVHEREKDTDLILAAVKEELKTNKTMKVILMSATMDTKKFSDYFNHCIAISIPGHTFQVEVFHLQEILVKTDFLSNFHNEYEAMEDPVSAYIEAYEEQIDHALLIHVIVYIHLNTPKDEAILVFLPEYKEIMEQKSIIEEQFESMHWNDYRLMLLHSCMEESNVFEHMPEGIPKIILSTNIAETSE